MKRVQRRLMKRDPVMTYMRIVEDLERLAAAQQKQELYDPRLIYEIIQLKRELERYGYIYLEGYDRPFRLVPEK